MSASTREKRLAARHRTPEATGRDIRPAIQEFCDGLAEMIAEFILEDEGKETPGIEAPAIGEGAETC